MQNSKRPSLKRQEGVVIVIALFIIALAATLAYVMMARLDRDTERTTLILHNVQAEEFAEGSLAWAIDVLQSNYEEGRKFKLIDKMPTESTENVVDGYTIRSKIDDMQGRFNLNNLSDATSRDTFIRLLRIVDKKLTLQKAQALTDAIQKWIDVQAPEDDELSQYYLHQTRPYRAARFLMTNPSEVLLVKGMTPELYKALKPFITALPLVTPINVQTAPAEVLAALSPSMTMEIAQTAIKLRTEQPLNSEGEFKDYTIIRDKDIKENLTVKSAYFLVETKVAIDAQKLVLYTLLERDSKEGKVRIMWQSKGIW